MILGLDISLKHPGISVVSKNKEIFKAYDYTEFNKEMITSLIRKIKRIIKEEQTKYAIIEDYAYGSIGIRKTQICELTGIIKYFLNIHGVEIILLTTQQIKKFGCGNGKTKKGTNKKEVKEYINLMSKNFPVLKSAKTTDEVDAYLLAKFGYCMVCGIKKGLKDYQIEVLEKAGKKWNRSKKLK